MEERQRAVFPLLSAEKRQVAGCVGGKPSGDPLAAADVTGSTGKTAVGVLRGRGRGRGDQS